MGPLRLMLADAGVTEQQWRVLRVLSEEGPMDPTSISERAVLLLPSLTRILQKLDEKAFVTRARDDNDRRRQVISITETGEALIEANVTVSREILQGFCDRLGQDKFDTLLGLLNELHDLED